MKLLTIDTSSLLAWLTGKGVGADVDQIMKWHDQRLVEVQVSTRVANVDAEKMHEHQRLALEQKLSAHGIQITTSSVRSDNSTRNGPDVLAGPIAHSDTEFQRFEKVVGNEPHSLPRQRAGRKLRNKIEDYAPLRDHYATKRDVFITNETRDFFNQMHRWNYKAQLGLVIQSPREFVDAFRQTL